MKKIISVLLVMVMLLSMAPTNLIFASAATSGTTGACTWTLNGTELTISGNGAMGNYSSTSPWGTNITSVVIENGVTTIGECSFYDCDSLTSITIPDSVTTIGSLAFWGCDSLTSMIIGNSVTSIGDCTFLHCYSLESVYITDIAKWCAIDFVDSYSNPLCEADKLYLNSELITDLVIPDGVTTIPNYSFSCENITSVAIPDSVTTIGSYAFSGCSNLTSITIPDSVTTIGGNAFMHCYSLTSITIPDSVTSIGNAAFFGCSSLSSVTIPASVTNISSSAFSWCDNLKKVALPTSVTTVEDSAFAYSGVKVVYIPKEITLIKNGAFDITEISYVYYGGSEADKASLAIVTNNDSLKNATWVYNATGLPQCQYGEFVYNNDATTTKDGTKTRTCSVCGDKQTVTAEGTKIQSNPFKDVKKSAFYYTPVLWAVENGITSGTSKTTFGPNEACTRGQIATFLWRAAGCPAPKTSKNPFTDVKKSDYYYKAVLWAVGEGITSGTSKTTFGPNEACTRGQIATFLWRAAGSPKPTTTKNPFTDVKTKDFYYKAVLWAVENGITAGTTKTTFEPGAPCTRGQIATFLYRAYN